ncbi:MAG: HD superfamily phosphohydrolase [Kiritimatiellia bacterium]|jgi:HD superfamily phosphohydrolase
MEVRDPIHGVIRLSDAERIVVEHPFVQRLRLIRATGFSVAAFPSATQTRFAHSLGVMHLAGHAFDSAYEGWDFSNAVARRRLRACLRLAALCHDLGHSPFSHCTEFAMPPLEALCIDWFADSVLRDRRSTHEDYTIAILENTSLSRVIDQASPCTARHVASLISLDVTLPDDFFVDGGMDHRRVLSQIVSSELDVDRLDYLGRDSYHTGARYGQVDVQWLLSHMRAHPSGDHMTLALDASAIYAFDDFLIARHHMFLMVYFHHKSVVYEEMLKRYVVQPDCPWQLSADLDVYLYQDDVDLLHHLRTSSDPWARRIVERRPYKRVLELHGTPTEIDLTLDVAALHEAGIRTLEASATGRLSRYEAIGQKRRSAPEILVIERFSGRRARQEQLPGMAKNPALRTLNEVTEVFQRYADDRRVARIFVPPDQERAASAVLDGLR